MKGGENRMAPERVICRVLAASQAVILCAMHKNTRGGITML